MPTRDEYNKRVRIVVMALFPRWSDEAADALVWVIVDFLMSLDAIANDTGAV